MIEAFVEHRKEVVTRRTLYLLRRARQRAHILEGQAVALANIDEVIELIKSSPTGAEAREGLIAKTWRAEDLRPSWRKLGSMHRGRMVCRINLDFRMMPTS